jgi:hypothetical protein
MEAKVKLELGFGEACDLSAALGRAISALEVIVERDHELGEGAARADATALETLRRLRHRIDAETSDLRRGA